MSEDEIEKKIMDEIRDGIRNFCMKSNFIAELGPITIRKLNDGRVYDVEAYMAGFSVKIKERAA